MTNKKPMLAVAIAMMCAASAGVAGAAEVKLPKELPPFGQDKSLPVPQITKQRLANGLEVWVVPREGLPRVDYVLAVRGAGFAADAANQPGFAAMLSVVLGQRKARRAALRNAEAAR